MDSVSRMRSRTFVVQVRVFLQVMSIHRTGLKKRFMVCDNDDASKKKKRSLLLHALGLEAIEIYETFSFTSDEGQTTTDPEFEEVLAKFEMHFLPRANVT